MDVLTEVDPLTGWTLVSHLALIFTLFVALPAVGWLAIHELGRRSNARRANLKE